MSKPIDTSWYKQALDVQDACNLSGVVHAFARFMTHASECGLGTEEKNRHPVSVLFASKISSLTGEAFADAYEACMKRSR